MKVSMSHTTECGLAKKRPHQNSKQPNTVSGVTLQGVKDTQPWRGWGGQWTTEIPCCALMSSAPPWVLDWRSHASLVNTLYSQHRSANCHVQACFSTQERPRKRSKTLISSSEDAASYDWRGGGGVPKIHVWTGLLCLKLVMCADSCVGGGEGYLPPENFLSWRQENGEP